ncbi:bifunctional diguanylate cyclase/phosphodiesterase [Clostridium sp. D2Q-11]|uniref:Bifunctional diguanylate cyclase/phosphodiesterase n=1 Tax=Anaeromonas frigoriresistens TaxID=2683708 RepID=A0A942UYA7_9FIRM|nr:bifunctional diguanylate cyclase/phosphodiesterase [Anaeromonas frigoriresistens]MBS4539044.1 bifunctional diguanylate cyclase/phosphodiesterase [Anaeromonas frigoriresistens]
MGGKKYYIIESVIIISTIIVSFIFWEQKDLVLYSILIMGTSLSMLAMTCNRKLKKEVLQTTEELKEANKDLLLQQEKIHNLAYYDGVTLLPNRTYFIDALKTVLEESKFTGNKFAILFIDLDKFKQINDTFGHDIGDVVLKIITKRLKKRLKSNGLLARAGGDEFFVLLKDIETEGEIINIAENILQSIKRPVITDKCEFYVSLSIGISIWDDKIIDENQLMKYADIAMYNAKKMGGNTYRIYYEELSKHEMENLMIANSLRNAIAKDELNLSYQPKIDIDSGEVVGMEALLRWENSEIGQIFPDKFIPIAEDTGLIIPIGTWVIKEACKMNKSMLDLGYPPMRVSVNISAKQFKDVNFINIIKDTLKDSGLPANQLELEITETFALIDVKNTIEMLSKLKEIGVYISVDDFGKGYSSLNYLRDMDIDELKIDKSFILGLTKNPKNASIAKTIIMLAHQLNMNVTAEGVEKVEDLLFLKSNKCDKVQGFYYSKPVTKDIFIDYLNEYNKETC